MLSKDTTFKSFLPPGILIVDDICNVIPGWHVIPTGTTIEEVHEHWTQKYPEFTPDIEIKPTTIISENVISQRTGEKYIVEFNGRYWSCSCVGYGWRGKCKHIKQIKTKIL